MADENILKKYSEQYSKYASNFKSAYDAVKVLKTKVDKDGGFVKHSEVQAKAKVLSNLHSEHSGNTEYTNKICSFLVELGIAEIVVDICTKIKTVYPECFTWDSEKANKPNADPEVLKKAQDLLRKISVITLNYSDCNDGFCIALGNAGLVPLYIGLIDKMKDCTADHKQYVDSKTQTLTQKTIRGRILSRFISTMYNLSRPVQCRKHFHACKTTMQVLVPLAKDKVAYFSSDALLTLAYIVDEENNKVIMANAEPVKLLIYNIGEALKTENRRFLGFSASELAKGLAQIAVNDSNKKLIGTNGAIPILVQMITSAKDDEERGSAALALWNLAFDSKNKEIITKTSGAVSALKKLKESKNKHVKKAASGALWEIEGKQAYEAEKKKEAASTSASKAAKPTSNHVMISYQWDVQSTMVEVKKKLQAAGYSVWIDLEQMGGSTLEAMANAVENAAVVLVCVSQKYKESANCRSEAEYAFTLRKDIVPLMMESNYRADGWLGMILGSKLWIDFSSGQNTSDSIEKLKKELGARGKGESAVKKASKDTVDAAPSGKKVDVSKWTVDDVTKWMEKIGLGESYKGKQKLTGKKLQQLAKMRNESADFFYATIKEDLGFSNRLDVMTFADELQGLVG
ncbi:hypothetical protein ACROYT_G016691 [Oculina patagonica]